MQIARIFIKPAGQVYCDVPLPEGTTLPVAWANANRDGSVISTDCIVPIDSVLYVATWTLNQEADGTTRAKPTVVPLFAGKFAAPPEPPETRGPA